MDTYEHAGDDQFHTLIYAASPRVADDDDHTRQLLREVADSVRGATSERPRRRIKIVAAIVAPLLVLGSASAAYAATGGWSWYWDMTKAKADASGVNPWLTAAQDPDARVTYSLPGGGTCELRLCCVDDGFRLTRSVAAPRGPFCSGANSNSGERWSGLRMDRIAEVVQAG